MKVEVTDQDIDAGFEALQKRLAPRSDCCAVSQALYRKPGVINVVTTYGHIYLRRVGKENQYYVMPPAGEEFIRQFDNWSRDTSYPRPEPISFEARLLEH